MCVQAQVCVCVGDAGEKRRAEDKKEGAVFLGFPEAKPAFS